MILSETRQAYALTARLIEGFVRITRFLAGGPLVALPAEPEPVEDDPPFVLRLLVSVLFVVFIIGGLVAFLLVAKFFGFDEILH